MRQVTYNGRAYLCEDHLKMQKGVHLRLYFAFMEDERRFIVGHLQTRPAQQSMPPPPRRGAGNGKKKTAPHKAGPLTCSLKSGKFSF